MGGKAKDIDSSISISCNLFRRQAKTSPLQYPSHHHWIGGMDHTMVMGLDISLGVVIGL